MESKIVISPLLKTKIELFKRGIYDFITVVNDKKHEKQEQALKILNDKTTVEFLYGGAAGGAKAQSLDSIVYTMFGKKRMGDIKIGDLICHPSGGFTRVIAIHPQGKKMLYEITFSDGAKTKCCKDHLWYVWFASKKSKQEKTNKIKGKIQTTEMLIGKLNKSVLIPLCNPIKFTIPKNRYENEIIDPYLMGVLLGDGSLTKSIGFTSADEFIVEEIKRVIPSGYTVNKIKSNYGYSITYNKRDENGYSINPLYNRIRELKLNCKSDKKHIPEKYKHDTLENRYRLIRGLMDTDGTVSSGKIYYCTTSEIMAKDFQYIVRSLGYKATITRHENDKLGYYIVYIQGRNKELLFELPRKKEKVRDYNGGYSECNRRIVSIKECGIEEAQCITVDSPDGLYITDDFIVTHNSWTGCANQVFNSLAYDGTMWFIGRESLKRLRESTLLTLHKVCKQYGIKIGYHYKYNGQDHYIEFYNGSRIYLLDLAYLPSDPLYERYGSIEYTGGWIEEGGEVNFGAYDTLKTRIGRHLNDKYNLLRKIFITCNPKKNWMYNVFYKPSINGTLKSDMIYLGCLVQENPFIEKDYIKALESTTDKTKRERLLKGNWDYDDNPDAMCSYDDIVAIFNNRLSKRDGEKYLTADIARFGSDKARICAWDDWTIIEQITYDKSKTTQIQDAINYLRTKYRIKKQNCIADDDGVGGGVVDNCEILGFNNNAKPINDENYQNLQTQCAYKLADVINHSEFGIDCEVSEDEKTDIINELQQLQTYKGDSDKKLRIKPKDLIKKDIGHSPDWRDVFLMRSYFDYKNIDALFNEQKTNYINSGAMKINENSICVVVKDEHTEYFSSVIYNCESKMVNVVSALFSNSDIDLFINAIIDQCKEYKPSMVKVYFPKEYKNYSDTIRNNVPGSNVMRADKKFDDKEYIEAKSNVVSNKFYYIEKETQDDQYKEYMRAKHNYIKGAEKQLFCGVLSDSIAATYFIALGSLQ